MKAWEEHKLGQFMLTNVLLDLASEIKMLIYLKRQFCGEMCPFGCDLSILSEMEGVALSEVLKMCHRFPGSRNFLSSQTAKFAITKTVLVVSQEANVSPPRSRPLLMEVCTCTEDAAQHFI